MKRIKLENRLENLIHLIKNSPPSEREELTNQLNKYVTKYRVKFGKNYRSKGEGK